MKVHQLVNPFSQNRVTFAKGDLKIRRKEIRKKKAEQTDRHSSNHAQTMSSRKHTKKEPRSSADATKPPVVTAPQSHPPAAPAGVSAGINSSSVSLRLTRRSVALFSTV